MFLIPEDGPDHPRNYYDICLPFEEFAHLRMGEPKVDFLMREHEVVEQGRTVIGTCCIPQTTGRLRKLFMWMLEDLLGGIPDFLFILDNDWWKAASEREREILMFHEMMHAGQAKGMFGVPRFHHETGTPIWCIRGHDVEEFTATVARYGAWDDELKSFIAAANQQSSNHE